MNQPQHHRAFLISAYWTLGLLLLGSVVHATESSLACPDWPTCFGTMVPEMTGGVFWEHLHRLVAGGLILFFGGAIYLTWKERPSRGWILKAAWGGMVLLLIQAVLGGLTVILLLPDAISSSHLGMAFLFLSLTTVLAVVSAPGWDQGLRLPDRVRHTLRVGGVLGAALVFVQSLVGAAVRHTDSGMACPDVPLCLGQWLPPLSNGMVALHFGHRVLGLLVLAVILWVGHVGFRRTEIKVFRRLSLAVTLVATTQVLLGFLSVYYRLAVVPVSLHTLLAATLLALLVTLATLTWAPSPRESAPGKDLGRRQPTETVSVETGG